MPNRCADAWPRALRQPTATDLPPAGAQACPGVTSLGLANQRRLATQFWEPASTWRTGLVLVTKQGAAEASRPREGA